MPPKRPNGDGEKDSGEPTGREKKKQKTVVARTINVQQSPAQAGPSTANLSASGMKGLPGAIDVEKFADARAYEINAMQSAMANAKAAVTHRVWQTLPRHLRRRAASHDVRRVPVRLREKAQLEMEGVKKKAAGRNKLPKRGKSKRIPKAEQYHQRQSADKVWLETHIWHAKRMKMDHIWGYKLAVQPTEKSFRPSHRASVHGAILHDVSYFSTVQLHATESLLKKVLARCCDPSGHVEASRYTGGGRACETYIYGMSTYPFGLISPVTIIWRPSEASESSTLPEKKSRKEDGAAHETTVPLTSPKRTVWLRAHPSAYDDVCRSLKQSITAVLDAARMVEGKLEQITEDDYSIEFSDLRDRFNAFEIMGPKSSQVIRGALSLGKSEKGRPEVKKVWNALMNLQTPGSVPRAMIIGLKVYDPRLNFPPKNAQPRVNESLLPSTSPAFNIPPGATLSRSELWDTVEKDFTPKFKKKELDERKSKQLIPGTSLRALDQDDRVPLMLIQRTIAPSIPSSATSLRTGPDTPLHGWTLLAPKGWGMPFLSSLIHTGTRVGGLRERRTQHFESGMPAFPEDYPTTAPYQAHMATRAKQEQERWERTPPAKRCNFEKLGTKHPWNPDWEELLGIRGGTEPGGDGQDPGSGDLIPTQPHPEEISMDVNIDSNKEHGKVHTGKLAPWLLRGARTLDMLHAAASAKDDSTSAVVLLEKVNALRGSKHLEPCTVSAEDLFKSALVLVRVSICGRGSPDDLAIIYELDEVESDKWRAALARKAKGKGSPEIGNEEAGNEVQLSKLIPKPKAVVGYVTSGNFSLQLGCGHAIGAVPARILVGLMRRDQRAERKTYCNLVKVRDRNGVVCMAASLEVICA
ncbi:hypothetical protein BOTBODRAFT_320829 [Botryobasidium botryosum FD-172 SS1]|uniref:POP1-domain-containing protein n=1 Tax=Botryobasidium botryosum (strain FD-172 SS1) TaxID=930990 RepID=A0A067MYQ9_BOTB1|nr:hypothetical protein BOTBODRAFT_320829 [Botryobasidium botryosum FD-172 SS1]